MYNFLFLQAHIKLAWHSYVQYVKDIICLLIHVMIYVSVNLE